MYLMPEDGQYNRNMLRVLTGVIKFAMADGIRLLFLRCVSGYGASGLKFKTETACTSDKTYTVSQPETPQSK